MNRIDRLFGILTLLQSNRYVTAESIAEKYEISVRTVYRDIKALGEQGIPVSFEQHKGYFVVQGYFLPPVSFTSEEANALLLTEALVHGFADRSLAAHYSDALNKVKSVLRTPQKEKLENLRNNIRLQIPDRLRSEVDHLSPLQAAISSREIIRIGYKKQNNEVTSREVEPIGLIFYAFSWHLIAWCHLRKEYRDFKISRIRTVTNTAIPFTRTDHMLITDYMKQLPVDY